MYVTTQNFEVFDKKSFVMLTTFDISLDAFCEIVSLTRLKEVYVRKTIRNSAYDKLWTKRLSSFIIPKFTVAWHI